VSLGYAYEMDSRAEEELMEGEKCRQYSTRQLVRSSDETLGDWRIGTPIIYHFHVASKDLRIGMEAPGGFMHDQLSACTSAPRGTPRISQPCALSRRPSKMFLRRLSKMFLHLSSTKHHGCRVFGGRHRRASFQLRDCYQNLQ
jgi:hypothetical protein